MTRHAKGTNLLTLVKLAKAGVEADQLAGLGEAERRLLEDTVLASEWYPFDAFENLLEAVHEQMLGGSDEAAMRMGEAAATEMLRGVHNIFVAEGDPVRTLEALPRMWDRYFDFGHVGVESEGERAAELTIGGYTGMGRCHGLVFVGWGRTAVELSGAEVASYEIVRSPWEGAEDLQVRVEWKWPEGAAGHAG